MLEMGYSKIAPKIRSRLYYFVLMLLCISMFTFLSACNTMSDGVSVTLSDEEYQEQLSIVNNSDLMVIFDAGVPLSEFPGDSVDSAVPANPFIAEVLRLVNIEREKGGLQPLNGGNIELNQAAQKRAEEIIVSFSHTRPNGQPWKDALKEYNVVHKMGGENVAKGHKTPEIVVTRWMASEGHKANIMNEKFNNIGIGVAADKSGVLHWAQMFTN